MSAGSFFSSEQAGRILGSVMDQPADPELVAQGWERRFVTDGRRLSEFVQLYESMGYEVRAEPVRADEIGPDCVDCRLIILLQFHTLYTRINQSRLPTKEESHE